jgi:hypothetical protein
MTACRIQALGELRNGRCGQCVRGEWLSRDGRDANGYPSDGEKVSREHGCHLLVDSTAVERLSAVSRAPRVCAGRHQALVSRRAGDVEPAMQRLDAMTRLAALD